VLSGITSLSFKYGEDIASGVHTMEVEIREAFRALR
jgi:hypothetical protein